MCTGSRSSGSSAYIGTITGSTVAAFLAVLLCAIACYCVYWKHFSFSPVHSKHSQASETDMIPGIMSDDPDLVNSHDIRVTSHKL